MSPSWFVPGQWLQFLGCVFCKRLPRACADCAPIPNRNGCRSPAFRDRSVYAGLLRINVESPEIHRNRRREFETCMGTQYRCSRGGGGQAREHGNLLYSSENLPRGLYHPRKLLPSFGANRTGFLVFTTLNEPNYLRIIAIGSRVITTGSEM